MSLAFYKPNSKNTGCAFNFRTGVNKKMEPALYVSAIQQFSWDDSRKTGNFSGNRESEEKNISVKFNEFEVGGMLCAFKNRIEYSAFHSFEQNKTSIKFTPWDKQVKVQDKTIKVPAFGIVFTRNGNQTFRIPLEPGEVESLAEFLKFFLGELYSHRRRQEIRNIKNRNQEKSAPSKPDEEAPF